MEERVDRQERGQVSWQESFEMRPIVFLIL